MQLSLFDKRWEKRRERWRKPSDRPLFDPSEGYGVEVIAERYARAMVAEHHYSGSFPAARLSVGLVRKTPGERRLVGVAVFSVPVSQDIIPKHTGLEPRAGVELGRFVCLPEVAFNGETWFLPRAFEALQAEKTEVRAVLSYADPVERRDAAGMLTKPAHAGTIYQGSNAAFLGRARGGWLWLDRDGRRIEPRGLSKIRNNETGREAVEARLVAAGCEARRHGEEPAAWLDRVLREPLFRRLKHPGNFTYVFGLDRETREYARRNHQPYPKLQPKERT